MFRISGMQMYDCIYFLSLHRKQIHVQSQTVRSLQCENCFSKLTVKTPNIMKLFFLLTGNQVESCFSLITVDFKHFIGFSGCTYKRL